MTSGDVNWPQTRIPCFSFPSAGRVRHSVEVIHPRWWHHTVSWHQGDSGLQETQAALGAEGVHCTDRLHVGKSAQWRDANDVGVEAAQAGSFGETLSASFTRLICHHFPWLLSYPLEYNSYHPTLSSQQKDCEVVNLSHTHDLSKLSKSYQDNYKTKTFYI